MKKIVITPDYDFGVELEIGKRQTIRWGDADLEITSHETDEEVQIQLDLLRWRRAFETDKQTDTPTNNNQVRTISITPEIIFPKE